MGNWIAEHWMSITMLCASGVIFLCLWVDKMARRKDKKDGEDIKRG